MTIAVQIRGRITLAGAIAFLALWAPSGIAAAAPI
jgi:hypothetical protein